MGAYRVIPAADLPAVEEALRAAGYLNPAEATVTEPREEG
jgi:hypothetical protein